MGKFDGGFGSGAGAGSPGATDVAVADGGTGASTAADARTNLNVPTLGSPTTPDANADNVVGATSATKKPWVIQLAANQTANAEQIQNSAGAVIRGIDARGMTAGIHWDVVNHYLNGSGVVDDPNRDTGVTMSGTGTGTAAGVSYLKSKGGCLGVCQMTTGTDATGKATVYSPDGNWLELGVVDTYVGVKFRIEDLSDGTDTYALYLGAMDSSSTGGDATDGVYVRYTHGTNNGKFELVTRAAGVETATDTGVTADADTWYLAVFYVNAAGTSAKCWINGVAAGTSTTNIPTSTNYTAFGGSIVKSAGVTPRLAYIDLWALKIDG